MSSFVEGVPGTNISLLYNPYLVPLPHPRCSSPICSLNAANTALTVSLHGTFYSLGLIRSLLYGPLWAFDLSSNVSPSEKPSQSTQPTLALVIQGLSSHCFFVFFFIYCPSKICSFNLFLCCLGSLNTNLNSMTAGTLSVLFTMLLPNTK